MQQAQVYYVGGYHLTVCPDAVTTLGKEAAKEDKKFVLSLSAPFICQFFKQQLDDTMPYWDYVIGNEAEARAWAEGRGVQSQDVKVIAEKLANGEGKVNKKRKRVVVFTQGTEGTVVAVQGEKVRELGIREVGVESICDTNGAG